MAMNKSSAIDSPSSSRKISFAGSPAVAGKSKRKTRKRINSFRFFIPPSITVKEETCVMDINNRADNRQQDSRTKQIFRPTQRPPTEHDVPNSQPILTDVGLDVSAHHPRSFRLPKRQFWKGEACLQKLPGCWRRLHYVEDENNVICHPCTRAHITHHLAGDCSLVRRFCSPKVRKSEIKGSSFRRFCSPKVRKSDDDFYSILL